jgi:hypothetical protein
MIFTVDSWQTELWRCGTDRESRRAALIGDGWLHKKSTK